MTRTLACVVGARPNFMKMAPLLKALAAYPHVRPVLIHTGQHYDAALSDVFFEELGMRRPDISLEVGSGKHGAQTAKILERMESTLEQGPPAGGRYDRVVVVGDVNSTMAAALAADETIYFLVHAEQGSQVSVTATPDASEDLVLARIPRGHHVAGRVVVRTRPRRREAHAAGREARVEESTHRVEIGGRRFTFRRAVAHHDAPKRRMSDEEAGVRCKRAVDAIEVLAEARPVPWHARFERDGHRGARGLFAARHNDADRLDLVDGGIGRVAAAACGVEQDLAIDFLAQAIGQRGAGGGHKPDWGQGSVHRGRG